MFAASLAGATLRAAFDLRLVFEHANGEFGLVFRAAANITFKAVFVWSFFFRASFARRLVRFEIQQRAFLVALDTLIAAFTPMMCP